MYSLVGLVELRDGEPVLRGSGVALAEVEGRLSAGEGPAALGLGATELVAALAYLGLGPDGSEGPPLEQARPARPWLAGALGPEALAGLLPGAEPTARLALAAGLLQVHDFWEASHQAAQGAEDRGERRHSAYWHGIAHRREPDPGNAAYWFRRVGKHPLFPTLAGAAADLLASESGPAPPWASEVVRGGTWDPFAFNEACTSARPGSADARLARRLQRLELDQLLGASLESASG